MFRFGLGLVLGLAGRSCGVVVSPLLQSVVGDVGAEARVELVERGGEVVAAPPEIGVGLAWGLGYGCG